MNQIIFEIFWYGNIYDVKDGAKCIFDRKLIFQYDSAVISTID